MAVATSTPHVGPTAWFRNPDLIEIIEAVLLSLATIVTAWSAYQAALWDGEQSARYTEASAARADGTRLSDTGNAQLSVDLSEFELWLAAETGGNHELAVLIRAQMRDGLEAALEAWTAAGGLQRTDEAVPASPFSMPEYVIAERALAEGRIAAAEDHFRSGEEANRRSDRYVLVTVVFALVLFVVGIGSKFKQLRVRAGLAGFGALALFGGVVFMALQPVAALTP
jgi:hypothetical protein